MDPGSLLDETEHYLVRLRTVLAERSDRGRPDQCADSRIRAVVVAGEQRLHRAVETMRRRVRKIHQQDTACGFRGPRYGMEDDAVNV
jgi:hypothetical protein